MAVKKIRTEEEIRDLGFGIRASSDPDHRMLNKDGSFNVTRQGYSFFQSQGLYLSLLTMSWYRFYLLVLIAYVAVNALFALVYAFVPGALTWVNEGSFAAKYFDAFNFSVHTFTTIGYGHLRPVGTMANTLVTIQSFVGMLGLAVVTGLLFARFSRPTAKIGFSDNALVSPYKTNERGFMFRIVNLRKSELINVNARVFFTCMSEKNGKRMREFYELDLERDHVAFFPLNWTIVHPISENSPLAKFDAKRLEEANAEFLILLTGFDETFSQTVNTRSSYKFSEVVWGARFVSMYESSDDDMHVSVDVGKLSSFERTVLPT